MTETQDPIPPRLRQIIEDFQWSEGREKLELLIQFANRLPELPEWLSRDHSQMEPVPECMTPVQIYAQTKDDRLTFYFEVPQESPTVRGFAALMAEGLNDLTPQQILTIPNDFYLQMELDKVLTHQRLNGIAAILAHMKRLALQAVSK